MNCPVCGKQMVEEDFGGARVDVCKNGCKGIWFDWGELSSLDEGNEGVGEALQEALRSPRVNDASRGQLGCPKCGMPMHSHRYSNAKEVSVDECYGCGGFFLDSGELRQMRDNYMSEKEQDAYVEKLLAEGGASGIKLLEETARLKVRTESVRRFGNLLRTRVFLPIP